MNTLKRFFEKRRLEKQAKVLRQKQLLEVKKYMKKVYNPLYYGVKPKNSQKTAKAEELEIYMGVASVYNPPTEIDLSEYAET